MQVVQHFSVFPFLYSPCESNAPVESVGNFARPGFSPASAREFFRIFAMNTTHERTCCLGVLGSLKKLPPSPSSSPHHLFLRYVCGGTAPCSPSSFIENLRSFFFLLPPPPPPVSGCPVNLQSYAPPLLRLFPPCAVNQGLYSVGRAFPHGS